MDPLGEGDYLTYNINLNEASHNLFLTSFFSSGSEYIGSLQYQWNYGQNYYDVLWSWGATGIHLSEDTWGQFSLVLGATTLDLFADTGSGLEQYGTYDLTSMHDLARVEFVSYAYTDDYGIGGVYIDSLYKGMAPVATPEPASMTIMMMSLLGLGFRKRSVLLNKI